MVYNDTYMNYKLDLHIDLILLIVVWVVIHLDFQQILVIVHNTQLVLHVGSGYVDITITSSTPSTYITIVRIIVTWVDR